MALTVFIGGRYLDFFAVYSPNLIMRVVPAYILIYLITLIKEKSRDIVQNRLEESNLELKKNIEALEKANEEKNRLISDLEASAQEIKTLHGILPICVNCKKIRDDEGYWHQVEIYIRDHSEADFTHGLCPECRVKLYPQLTEVKK
jgi:DNA-directed RNA polymerase subunit M/transcription elongation factor TFIIS